MIYVTGHRNLDSDSIASAIALAELLRRIDPGEEYQAVRLGDLNAQTRWLLERAGAEAPSSSSHLPARVRRDARALPGRRGRQPVRDVGLEMSNRDLDLMPIVGDEGHLVGV